MGRRIRPALSRAFSGWTTPHSQNSLLRRESAHKQQGLPHALVVTREPEADERRGREKGQQAEAHHRVKIVLSAAPDELAQKKVGGFGHDGHTDEASAEIGLLSVELGGCLDGLG